MKNRLSIIIGSLTVILFCGVMLTSFNTRTVENKTASADPLIEDSTIMVYDTVECTTYLYKPDVYEVTGTYYNPVAEQCDGSPLHTADRSAIDLDLLKEGSIKWVALSRDLLSRWGGPYSYGDTLYVHHPEKQIKGMWIVHDCMNARYTRMIDFLVHLENKFPGKSRSILISNKPFYQ